MKLYETYPAEWEEIPEITAYIPAEKKCNGAVVIFPGGAYRGRAAHEGKGYAEFLQSKGICAFDVAYRVSPHRFPLELLDARRAVRWVRAHAEEYGIDKNKIAVMGSSAGGHLAAMVSTYIDPIEFEGLDSVDAEDYLPNAQILCYPVITGDPVPSADRNEVKGVWSYSSQGLAQYVRALGQDGTAAPEFTLFAFKPIQYTTPEDKMQIIFGFLWSFFRFWMDC